MLAAEREIGAHSRFEEVVVEDVSPAQKLGFLAPAEAGVSQQCKTELILMLFII